MEEAEGGDNPGQGPDGKGRGERFHGGEKIEGQPGTR
jgi:hypothetical protein